MVEVENALRDSFNIYRANPVFFLPHLIESFLNLIIFVSLAISVILAVGVHFKDLIFDDPEVFFTQFSGAGMGLIVIIIILSLFGLFLIAFVKAGAISAVVGMANQGFKGEKVSLSIGLEDVKKHSTDIFLYWIILGSGFTILFASAFIPTFFLAILGGSEALAVGFTFFGLFFALVVAIILYSLFMFAPQIIIVSDVGSLESLRRSIQFVRNNLSAVVIYIVVVLVFSFALMVFFSVLSFIPALLYEVNEFLGFSIDIFFTLSQLGISLLVAPFFEILKTKLVIDA